MHPSVSASPASSLQPPVALQQNGAQLNMTLTIAEGILVVFAKRMFEHSLNQGNQITYFGASPNLQQHFNTLIATRFSHANLTEAQRQLSPLIESLWFKAKTTVENELKIKNVQADIQNEANMHIQAQKLLEGLKAEGISGGRVFTERQVKLIIKI